MTPEAEEHLDKAREPLIKARGLLDVMHYSDEAARAAYLAGFHAAQALISERTGRIAKSHSGVRSTFARLVKEDPLKAPLAGRSEYHRSQFSQRRPSIRENSPSLSVTTI